LTYGAHREALEFGRDEYVELKRYAGEIGLTLFATAFDFRALIFSPNSTCRPTKSPQEI
jgi:N-acetylneuraminate synthase/sialic acid synthase